MNREWSELNKSMQSALKKSETFPVGVATCLSLRNQLMQAITPLQYKLDREDFNAIPFRNADGYHSKTIAYSLWHIARIEDIVAHRLVGEDEEIFFKNGYQQRINSPIITTGNELVKEEIAEFSRELNIDELFSYISEVKNSTDEIISSLQFKEIKRKISQDKKEFLQTLNVVDINQMWLIDYWCSKNICGLIQMPFSRHWIMHIEAILRIKNKISK